MYVSQVIFFCACATGEIYHIYLFIFPPIFFYFQTISFYLFCTLVTAEIIQCK